MNKVKKTITSPEIFTLVLAVGMLTLANVIKNMDVIFPEGAALALGCWVNRERSWIRKPWHIVILPTVSSAFGVVLNLMGIEFLFREWIALFVVVFLLFIFQSSISPSISAVLLPIVLNIHSWIFVFSVFGLTFIIMMGTFNNREQVTIENDFAKENVVSSILYMLIGFAWIGMSEVLHLHLAIIPPLMVVLYEWLSKRCNDIKLAIRQIVLLFSVSLTGALAVYIWPHSFVISGSIATLSAMLLMRILRTRLVPAMAISLLPILLGKLPVFEYPLFVLGISSMFFLISLVFSHLRTIAAPDRVSFRS